MRLKNSVIMQEIDDRIVLVDANTDDNRFHGVVNMNQTAAFIAKLLENETSKEEIVKALTDKYDVSPETADKSAQKVIDQFREVGLMV